jgi:hypothetical protein
LMLVGCGVVTAYFATAYRLKAVYDPVLLIPKATGHMVELQRPFIKFDTSEFAVLVPDYWFGKMTDNLTDPTRSSVLLFEDDRPIGPPHSLDLSEKGHGRFSHAIWPTNFAQAAFLFSSSDNSDPNTNGRAYWALLPEETGK